MYSRGGKRTSQDVTSKGCSMFPCFIVSFIRLLKYHHWPSLTIIDPDLVCTVNFGEDGFFGSPESFGLKDVQLTGASHLFEMRWLVIYDTRDCSKQIGRHQKDSVFQQKYYSVMYPACLKYSIWYLVTIHSNSPRSFIEKKLLRKGEMLPQVQCLEPKPKGGMNCNNDFLDSGDRLKKNSPPTLYSWLVVVHIYIYCGCDMFMSTIVFTVFTCCELKGEAKRSWTSLQLNMLQCWRRPQLLENVLVP